MISFTELILLIRSIFLMVFFFSVSYQMSRHTASKSFWNLRKFL